MQLKSLKLDTLEIVYENELNSFFKEISIKENAEKFQKKIFKIDYRGNIFYYSKNAEIELQKWWENEKKLYEIENQLLYLLHYIDNYICYLSEN